MSGVDPRSTSRGAPPPLLMPGAAALKTSNEVSTSVSGTVSRATPSQRDMPPCGASPTSSANRAGDGRQPGWCPARTKSQPNLQPPRPNPSKPPNLNPNVNPGHEIQLAIKRWPSPEQTTASRHHESTGVLVVSLGGYLQTCAGTLAERWSRREPLPYGDSWIDSCMETPILRLLYGTGGDTARSAGCCAQCRRLPSILRRGKQARKRPSVDVSCAELQPQPSRALVILEARPDQLQTAVCGEDWAWTSAAMRVARPKGLVRQ